MYSNVAKTIHTITIGAQRTAVFKTTWYITNAASSAFIFNPFSLSTFQSSPQILDRPTQNHPNTKRSTIGVQATAKIIQTSLNCSSSCSFLIMPSILEPGPGQGNTFFCLALSSNPLKSHSCWRRRRKVAAKHSSKTEFLPGQLGEKLREIVAGETREGSRDDCRDLLSYFELFCSILRKSSECRDLLSNFEPVLGSVQNSLESFSIVRVGKLLLRESDP